MKSCSKWEKNLVARQQRWHQDQFFLSHQMNTITASSAEHCWDDSVSYDGSSQPQLLVPDYLQFLFHEWIKKEMNLFSMIMLRKNKNASDSTDSFILLKTLHTLRHRVYFWTNQFMGQWPCLFSLTQLSEFHNAYFRSLVQSIVFKNVGLYFNQTTAQIWWAQKILSKTQKAGDDSLQVLKSRKAAFGCI